MKKIVLFLAALMLLPVFSGCAQPVSAEILKSDKPRQTPAPNPADTAKLVEGNSAFAWELYQLLKAKEGNLFYSPYSISEALSMTYGGARGTTEQQMAGALKFLLAQGQLHPAFNNLDQELAKRGQGAKGKDEKGFRLNVVNAIWGQRDFTFLSGYLDLLAQNYGAGLRVVDFIKSPEPSRQTINQWVADQTEDKIKDLLPQGSITDMTRLVLTNAIYFNAAWLNPFKVANTTTGAFTLLDGSKINIPMMKQQTSFGYAKGDNYKAVELLYDGAELSMVVLLPESGQFKSFEAGLNSQTLNDVIKNIKRAEVNLTMPKFKVESQFGLKEALSKAGMPVAFTEQADFSGMDGKKDLLIQDVVHKAFVSVDEAGTEAAAATGVIVGVTSLPNEIIEFTIDRPFIFLIRDIKTGAIIFVGRVVNPA